MSVYAVKSAVFWKNEGSEDFTTDDPPFSANLGKRRGGHLEVLKVTKGKTLNIFNENI